MVILILGIFLLIVGATAIALQRLYSSVPAYELKRLSGQGDVIAHDLYRPVAYGTTLRLLLWVIAVISFSAGLLLLAQHVTGILRYVLAAATFGIGLVWLPSLRLTPHTITFARWFSPVVAFLLHHLHPILHPIASRIRAHRESGTHSRMYEKEDLVALLHQQKEQPDNRISHNDLDLAHQALAFDERQAADIVIPRTQSLLVNADDTVGPILLDQLHKSGQASFLAYKDTPDTVVGSFLLKDAVAARQGGRVMDLVRPELTFVHEDFTLRQVLAALLSTTQQMAIVINSFEELVGTISLKQLLSELLNDQDDVGLQYENRATVAAYGNMVASRMPKTAPGQPEASASSPEVPEVVE